MTSCKTVKFDELYQVLKSGEVSLFGALAGAQIDDLWDHLNIRIYRAGEKIFEQGDLPNEVYIVLSGKVDFVLENQGVLQIEACFQAGQTFGESAYLGIQPHVGSAQVRSTGDAEIIVLTRDALMNIQKQDKDLFALLVMNLSREVSRKYQSCLVKR